MSKCGWYACTMKHATKFEHARPATADNRGISTSIVRPSTTFSRDAMLRKPATHYPSSREP